MSVFEAGNSFGQTSTYTLEANEEAGFAMEARSVPLQSPSSFYTHLV
jgi:hypothetical protein